jgi:hypothetical protein
LRATRPKTLAIRRKTPIPDSTRKEVDRIVESVLASLQHDAVERLCNDDQAAAHIRSLVRRSIRRGRWMKHRSYFREIRLSNALAWALRELAHA